MRLSHLLIAGATAVSFSAIAADEQKERQQPQAQSSQSSQQGQQQASQSQETVKQAQEKLSAAGHQVQPDGIMGPKTQAALKEFQQSKGLQASGQLDQQTIAALEIEQSAATGGSSSGSSSPGSSDAESKSGSDSKDESKSN